MIQGVILALVTGLLWAIGPMCFASIGRRIGAFGILLLGRIIGALLLATIATVHLLMEPAARHIPGNDQVLWIAISSVLGMVIGDGLLYEAFVSLGPRRSTQILMLTPVFSAGAAWLGMGEAMGPRELIGAAIVMSGVAVAVTARARDGEENREPGTVTTKGIIYAAVAAALIGFGAAAGRRAFTIGQLDPIIAGAMRVAIAAALLGLLPLLRGQVPTLLRHLRDPWILQRFIPGVLAGPTIGILCYMAAMKRINPGLLSTLSQTSPLFMIPMIWYRYRAGIGWRAALATLAAIGGVAVICWH